MRSGLSLPWQLALVHISGIAEIGLGLLLLFQRWSALAGWGLIALLIAVFPANIHMVLHAELYTYVSPSASGSVFPFNSC